MSDAKSQRELKASLKAKRAAKDREARNGTENDYASMSRSGAAALDKHRAWEKEQVTYWKHQVEKWEKERKSERYKTDPEYKQRIDVILQSNREHAASYQKRLRKDSLSRWIGTAIVWGVFLVPILVVIGFCTNTGPSREESIQACVSNAESKCERACEADPTFLYCSTVYGDQVIGSGCVAEMNGLPLLERTDKCKRSACAAYTAETLDHCEKQYSR